ncbi:CAP domain-containing protein [Neobacillus terrae]|uniref:CAP domain-containing protein n=1 Tax=Neobacillus terrae TaxID=3034837 RepID=UPI00140BD6FD|nr:CAP domain-containing protein [Neobacillus terrae]NHM30716.1 CAP domain-containing protein [Neobacillus terrae]
MFRIIKSIVYIFVLYFAVQFIINNLGNNTVTKDSALSGFKDLNIKKDIGATVSDIYQDLRQTVNQLSSGMVEMPQTLPKEIQKKIPLKAPARQVYSVYNVEIGDSKAEVERHLGSPKRSSMNEYGLKWYAYHDHYQHFMMVMYDQYDKVVGLYTDQDLIASTNGIKLGSKKEDVRAKMGEPSTTIQKRMVLYKMQNNDEYDMFLLNGVYTTIFYDKHEGNTVTAIQLIDQNTEQQKTNIYTKASPELREGFEYQLFDLTNSSRLQHRLPILSWDQHVRDTAAKHSTDMAEHHYFDHTDPRGKSPFDRMADDHIQFNMAGENLAYGQFSSIFAHEGLMNSLGHRENILRNGYEFLGVGVAFNDQSQPYYTENYYAK